MATCFYVDNITGDNFRDAVRAKYGKKAWGKIRQELKNAMDNHAARLNNGT